MLGNTAFRAENSHLRTLGADIYYWRCGTTRLGGHNTLPVAWPVVGIQALSDICVKHLRTIYYCLSIFVTIKSPSMVDIPSDLQTLESLKRCQRGVVRGPHITLAIFFVVSIL